MTTRRCRKLILWVIAVVAPAAPAQQMPRLALDRPSWTAVEPFTSVAALRELPGGAVLVSDAEERGVFLITAAGRTVRRLGRNGSGPGEYGTPTRLIALPGDSTMLLDRDARRFLLLDPKGGIVETKPFPPSVAAASAFMRGADRQGRVYFTEGAFAGAPTGPSALQVRRWNRNSGRVDDVATLLAPNPKPVERTLPSGQQAVIRRLMPFTPQDEWVVAPSGRVALVRAIPYRVDWWETDGRITGGRPVTFSAVPVTEADKRVREPAGPPYRLEYPATKPPFREGGVVVDDLDRVYVRRERVAAAPQTTWDIFDARGVHLGTAVLPTDKHIVAVSSRFIYVVRTDDDDLRWLEAYAR